jgi:hypothetical protein
MPSARCRLRFAGRRQPLPAPPPCHSGARLDPLGDDHRNLAVADNGLLAYIAADGFVPVAKPGRTVEPELRVLTDGFAALRGAVEAKP